MSLILRLIIVISFIINASSIAEVYISPSSRSIAQNGGGGGILTTGSGSFTTSSSNNWITVVTPAGDVGDYVFYAVGGNNTADDRIGHIDIVSTYNGDPFISTHTVNQAGVDATLSPASVEADYAAQTGIINVSSPAGVTWSAIASDDWVTLSPANGMSVGNVTYTLEEYAGVTPRTTVLRIAGNDFTLTQTGIDVNISPRSVEKSNSSDIIQVNVSAMFSTSWNVVPNESWISVIDGGPGSGDYMITLAIGTNPSYDLRSGTVSIGSSTLTINQKGNPDLLLSINPENADASPLGAYGNIAVLSTPDAPWSAQSLDPWVTIDQGSTGEGNGNIQYVAAANPTLSNRTGRIKISPPYVEPLSDLTKQLFVHVVDGDDDLSGWNRDLTGDIGSADPFDGVNPKTLTGQKLYRNDDALSVSMVLNFSGENAINRLVGFKRSLTEYSAIYLNELNQVVVDTGDEMLVSSSSLTPDVDNLVVVSSDDNNSVSIYVADLENQNAELIQAGSKVFGSAPFPNVEILNTSTNITIGRTFVPSEGNLSDATFEDLRFYGREISAYEVGKLHQISKTNSLYGEVPHVGDGENVTAEFNMEGQNLPVGGSSEISYSNEDQIIRSSSTVGVAFSNNKILVETFHIGGSKVPQIYFKETGSLQWEVTWYYEDLITSTSSEMRSSGWISNPRDEDVLKIEIYAKAENLHSYGNISSFLIIDKESKYFDFETWGHNFSSKQINCENDLVEYVLVNYAWNDLTTDAYGRALYGETYAVFHYTDQTAASSGYQDLGQANDNYGNKAHVRLSNPFPEKTVDRVVYYLRGIDEVYGNRYRIRTRVLLVGSNALSISDEFDGTDFTQFVYNFSGQLIENSYTLIRGDYNYDARYFYEYEYLDGSIISTSTNQVNDFGIVTDNNPNSDKRVKRITFNIRSTTSESGRNQFESRIRLQTDSDPIYGWHPAADRFQIDSRAILGDEYSIVSYRNHEEFFNTESGTYNFWIRFDSIPELGGIPQAIFDRVDTASGDWFSCSLQPGGLIQSDYFGSVKTFNADLISGNWHMFTISGKKNGNHKFYIDGSEIGNTADYIAYSMGTNSTPQQLFIGGWVGALDYVGFYDEELSAAEVANLYSVQAPRVVYHTVSQDAIAPSISPANGTVVASGGSTSTDLNLSGNVVWSASVNPSNPWLTITSASSGAGSTTIDISAQPNPTINQRVGTVDIAGETFTVTQEGLNFAVSSTDSRIFTSDGGSAWLDLSTEGLAQWEAISQNTWLSVAIGQSGTGGGQIFIVAAPMTVYQEDRIGSIVIGDETVYFTQRGYDLSISPQVAEVGGNAGAGEIGVSANVQQTWEAISLHPWITILGGNSGNGNGVVRYSVAENDTGITRTGKIIVSGEEYSITQTTSLIMSVINNDGGGSVTGSGNFNILDTAILTATPAGGYMFSHWSGDAVGNDNPLSVSMDTSKSVEAHFIEITTADAIVFNSRDRLGLYSPSDITADMIGEIDVTDTLINRNEDDSFRVSFGLSRATSLGSNDWSDISIQNSDISIESGKLNIDVDSAGDVMFYRIDAVDSE